MQQRHVEDSADAAKFDHGSCVAGAPHDSFASRHIRDLNRASRFDDASLAQLRADLSIGCFVTVFGERCGTPRMAAGTECVTVKA